jgi:hypothetical protein
MTPLDKTLKRAIKIKGDDYVITLAPEGLKISRKGHRLGIDLKWSDLVSGESALAVALHASIGRFETKEVPRPKKTPPAPSQRRSSQTAAAPGRPRGARAKGRVQAGRARAPKPKE